MADPSEDKWKLVSGWRLRERFIEELGQEVGVEALMLLLAGSLLRELRGKGWAVAVHNDYKQNGVPMTFWLMTKGNVAFKGEGAHDLLALQDIYAQVAHHEDASCEVRK